MLTLPTGLSFSAEQIYFFCIRGETELCAMSEIDVKQPVASLKIGAGVTP